MLRLSDIKNPNRTTIPRVDGADALAWQLKAAGITGWEREVKFHPTRRWKADVCFNAQKLAIEVNGYGANGEAGRHQRKGGIERDNEKIAELAIAGYRLIIVTTGQVKKGYALLWIERALKGG